MSTVDLRAQENVVVTTGPVSMVHGSSRIQPTGGTAGFGVGFNYLPYELPGEYANGQTNTIDGTIFDIAYANRSQPIQTSDWWTGIGLQWSGWVVGRQQDEGQIGRSTSFISEPFFLQFVDVNPVPQNVIPGIQLPVSGLRLWNQNTISVKTDGKIDPSDPVNWALNFAGRGNMARQDAPAVTVGLAGVNPLGLEPRTTAPFSNVKVESYSDWGTSVSYANESDKMQITMANGTPFVWFERTQGSAPLTVWAGELDPSGGLRVWFNHEGMIGVTVTTAYIPFNGLPKTTSTAAYVIAADSGTWTKQDGGSVSLFQNAAASRLAVLAMPHNVDPTDDSALQAAMNELMPYACSKIAETKLHYPPIPGSDPSVVADGQTLALGYDAHNAVVRTKHEAIAQPFPLAACPSNPVPLQVVFPHHRKAMIPSSASQILTSAGKPKYIWNGVIGEMHAYAGSSYVRALRTKGLLPFFPSVALQAGAKNPLNPDQVAAADIYEELKRWFFVQEPETGGNNIGSVARNVGTYSGVQTNTYMQSLAGLYEPFIIADQLARSTGTDQTEAAQTFGHQLDPDLSRSRAEVAAEVRGQLLQSLKELVGQWADVYTSQFFMYNTQFNSTVGYPSGYGSVQNFNDHHFHYGYFLRAAAMIGRSDPAWLQAYLPMIDALRRDVATYDRSDSSYPFLREFSPFYGHSWANGTSDAGGNDQESTSEAVNFAVGLVELGLLTGNDAWRDLGLYMFEEEILAAEQYWFNQDADLTQSPASGIFNGNWPASLVHFQAEDGSARKTTLITNTKQFGVFRNTFFGGIIGTYTIQATPLSAFTAYLGRNQNWLSETWQQFLLETAAEQPGIYQVIIASLQARLPGTDPSPTSPGLAGALTRIDTLHDFFPASPNVTGKHFAYSHAQLGQVDTSVVADTAMYGVFRHASGRSYSAYNPTGSPLTVTFSDANSGSPVKSLTVPAFALATVSDDQPTTVTDVVTPVSVDPARLYLRSGGQLLPDPGTFLPPEGQSSFPSSSAGLASTLQTVPVRPDKGSSVPLFPPTDTSLIQSWKGSFSGKLDPQGSNFTRFALYTNQTLHPGWQQDQAGAPNIVTVRFVYDFDSDGKPDRMEVLQNVPIFFGNSFLYQSKITEYYFDQIYGDSRGRIPVFIGGDLNGNYAAPFPQTVANGTITVELWGGSSGAPLQPVPVSQDASPLSNRASWVMPPYEK
jgi:hypothetical protein